MSIEMAQTTRGTVEALKNGVAMMKRIQKDIGGGALRYQVAAKWLLSLPC